MNTRRNATLAMVVTTTLLLWACGDRDVDQAGDTCRYNGKVYNSGDVFKAGDGCNSCKCNPEGTNGVGCSAKKCDGTSVDPNACHYNGKTYNTGDVFTAADGCNSCQCNPEGYQGVGCTKKGCPDLGTDDAGVAPSQYDDAYGGSHCGFEGTVCGSMCVNISRDPQHCGACFNACKSNEVCAGSGCVPSSY